jgi:hypothetical protein
VAVVHPDGRLDVAWTGSESYTEHGPAKGLRIISESRYLALRG